MSDGSETLSSAEAVDADGFLVPEASQPQDYRSERTQRSLARLYARRYGRGPLVGEGKRRF